MVIQNKKGWIKIIEAFFAVLLIASIAIVIVNSFSSKDISDSVYETELSILRGIELNNEFRAFILDAGLLPVAWSGFTGDLDLIKQFVIIRTPSYLNCEAQICGLADLCELEEDIKESVYAREIIISAEGDVYSPRKFKIFCWSK